MDQANGKAIRTIPGEGLAHRWPPDPAGQPSSRRVRISFLESDLPGEILAFLIGIPIAIVFFRLFVYALTAWALP